MEKRSRCHGAPECVVNRSGDGRVKVTLPQAPPAATRALQQIRVRPYPLHDHERRRKGNGFHGSRAANKSLCSSRDTRLFSVQTVDSVA